MSSKKPSSQSDNSIFAPRNSLIRRFQVAYRNVSNSHKEDGGLINHSKFQMFKSKLEDYIQGQKFKNQNTVGRFMYWKQPLNNQHAPKRSRTETIDSSQAQRINNDQKNSILKHLRRTSNPNISRTKSLPQKARTKVRIHSNITELRKKRLLSEPLSLIQERPQKIIHHTDWINRKKSVPICTINFMDFRNEQQNNMNIYNNYLCQKFGCSKDNPNVITQGNRFYPNKYSQILIVDEGQPFIKYSQSQDQLRGNSKFYALQGVRKVVNAKISKIGEVENQVGPWSKKGPDQEEEHLH